MRSTAAWNQVHWRPQTCIARSRVACPQRSWLFAPGSLTKHLVQASEGDFHVQVIRQEWARSCVHEARILNIAPHQLCLLREVLLICKGTPWVYARSLLPEASLCGKLRFLRKLDARPLGALLFREPSMRRGRQEIAHLNLQALPDVELEPPDRPVWGRRSIYFLHNQPLLVAEVFLPGIAEAEPPSG